MLLAFDRRLTTATGVPERPGTDQEESRLNIVVFFMSVNATITALKRAGRLAESLGAQITLVVPQVVPYPLPLTSPPVLLDFQEPFSRDRQRKSREHSGSIVSVSRRPPNTEHGTGSSFSGCCGWPETMVADTREDLGA
jgi:hypothetical protein